jgi:hypothetical protein
MRFRLLISGLISIQIVDLNYGGNRQCQLSNQIAQGLVVSHSMLSLWRQGKMTLRLDLEDKYWVFVTNSGYRFGDNPNSGIQRNTQVELNKMVPRGGLEPPTHGFSIHCSTN